MSDLQHYAYDGFGTKQRRDVYYNQAVRIPAGADRIECSGQGGWDPKTFKIPDDVNAQIDQAFANVELTLKDSGIKDGWKTVFRVNSYHVGLQGNEQETLARMVENMKKYMPDHQPIWTCIGVAALAEPEMKVEIEVVAFDEK
ncbi:hypothetical protein WHR41_08275 [Cladosporium halotolerans]|uniref:Uncharacterized protein n=1 Tax=Cladosporium halotolerans TaxID=1052096 RepID=A0AB34KIL2_9PEZI